MGRFGPDRVEEELAREFHELTAGEQRLLELFKLLNWKMDIIMAEIDDLNTAVEKMAAAVTVAQSDIKDISDKLAAALAAAGGSDPALLAAVEAAAQKLNGISDALSAATPSDG